MPNTIQVETDLSVDEFISVLERSTLAQRRPVDDRKRIQGMLNNATRIITVRNDEGLLIGVSRAISDLHYCTYLSDLAVDVQYQGHGIGKQLVRRTHQECGLQTNLLLLAAPAAETYYPHIGMQPHKSCWINYATAPELLDD